MDGQNNNQPLSPTIPNQSIFDANQIKPPVAPVAPINKQEIIAKHRKFPKGIVFGLLGVLVLLLFITLVAKIIASRNVSKETVLTWWSLDEDPDAVAPIINEYEQQHPNVKVQFVAQSKQDYAVRLANAFAQGKGPDIFEYHNSWVPMFAGNLAPTKDDFSNIFYPVASSDLKTRNGFIGVPLEYNGIALFVNQDILNAYGKNAPKTWDDFRALAQTLTLRDKNGVIQQAGAAMGVTSNVDYWQDIFALLMFQNGADLTNPSTPLGASALTFFSNFSKLDHIWDDTLPSSTFYFSSGHLAMYFGLYNDVFTIQKQNPNLHFAVDPLPQLPSNGTVNAVAYANYWANGVSSRSVNTTEAWNFLKFMTSQATLRELYANEKKVRGYGNLYPRPDMQQEILSDITAGPFVYQGSFARSWYLDANTFDGATGINSQVAKVYDSAIQAINGNGIGDKALQDAQIPLRQVLASYGIVPKPVATP